MNRKKLQKIKYILDGTTEQEVLAVKKFQDGVKQLQSVLEKEITFDTLESVNKKLAAFKKELDYSPLKILVETLGKDFKTGLNDLSKKIDEASDHVQIENLENQFNLITKDHLDRISGINTRVQEILKSQKTYVTAKDVEDLKAQIRIDKEQDDIDDAKQLKELTDKINKLKINRGGSQPRMDYINSSVMSKKYSDVNWKAGSGTTLSAADNNTTKQVDITIAASGGTNIEIPGGLVNGTNVTFTVSNTPKAVVIDNLTYWGSGDGYTYSAGTITCNSDRAPVSTIRSLY